MKPVEGGGGGLRAVSRARILLALDWKGSRDWGEISDDGGGWGGRTRAACTTPSRRAIQAWLSSLAGWSL